MSHRERDIRRCLPYVIWLIWLAGLAAITSRYQHASTAARHSAGAPARGLARPAVAIGPIPRRRAAARRRLLRRREARSDAALHGLGVRHLAPCGARDRRPLPVGPALVARRAARRAPGQRRAPARRQHVPDREPAGPAGGQHGGDHRGRAVAAPAHRPERGDGPHRAGGRHARGARDRDRDQRDRRHRVDGRRRSGRRVRRHGVLAHLVAGRQLRRAGRPAAAARVGPGSARGLAAHPDVGGRGRDRGRHGARRRRGLDGGADHLHGVPGADLGGNPVRASRRHAGRRDHRRRRDRGHGQRRRAVLRAADRPPDAQHAALHRGGGAHDAVPERRRERTRASLQGARRSAQDRGRPVRWRNGAG